MFFVKFERAVKSNVYPIENRLPTQSWGTSLSISTCHLIKITIVSSLMPLAFVILHKQELVQISVTNFGKVPFLGRRLNL